jgi:hypothetical protein
MEVRNSLRSSVFLGGKNLAAKEREEFLGPN